MDILHVVLSFLCLCYDEKKSHTLWNHRDNKPTLTAFIRSNFSAELDAAVAFPLEEPVQSSRNFITASGWQELSSSDVDARLACRGVTAEQAAEALRIGLDQGLERLAAAA